MCVCILDGTGIYFKPNIIFFTLFHLHTLYRYYSKIYDLHVHTLHIGNAILSMQCNERQRSDNTIKHHKIVINSLFIMPQPCKDVIILAVRTSHTGSPKSPLLDGLNLIRP